MRRMLLMAAVLFGTLASAPAYAQANDSAYAGEVMLVAFNFCPQGWHATDGSLLPIQQNAQLFALIGSAYGGDGKTTFGLPKLSGPKPANGPALTHCISLQGPFPLHAEHAGGNMMGPKGHH
ncbi:MAG TPA: phage tail protein [Rhizomicrobium sp.]